MYYYGFFTLQFENGPNQSFEAMRIDGKVVLITGASDGIGAACVRAFRKRGARLALIARSAEKLDRVAAPEDVTLAGDITAPDDRRAIVQAALERFGAIDILVNSAGVGLYAPAWSAPMDGVRQMLEVNFFALLEMAQLVVPVMRKQGRGTIVNIGSIAGKVTLPWFTLYSASKYAVGSLTDGLRMELKRDGVHAMTVCPGYVSTGFQSHVLGGSPPPSIQRSGAFRRTPEYCAEAIARGVERDARTVVTPRTGWFFIAMERLFPKFVDARLEGIYYSQ